jgi:hypothetical protein
MFVVLTETATADLVAIGRRIKPGLSRLLA